jgi:hypothetical protein
MGVVRASFTGVRPMAHTITATTRAKKLDFIKATTCLNDCQPVEYRALATGTIIHGKEEAATTVTIFRTFISIAWLHTTFIRRASSADDL